MNRIHILLKLSGTILQNKQTKEFDATLVSHIADQLKKLSLTHLFSIVIGGGNLFRGSDQSSLLHIDPEAGHSIGMLATLLNGTLLKELFSKKKIDACILHAVSAGRLAESISIEKINCAIEHNTIIIFTGGTGNPFFTTDTAAIVRALQVKADEVWKGTDIDGIYSKDPAKYADATIIKSLTYEQALQKNIHIMDQTAFAMAKEYQVPIRVFDIFEKDSLLQAADNSTFGSIVT